MSQWKITTEAKSSQIIVIKHLCLIKTRTISLLLTASFQTSSFNETYSCAGAQAPGSLICDGDSQSLLRREKDEGQATLSRSSRNAVEEKERKE